ncbi:hypothetical protein [Streptomyces sp. NPDC050485]|uniref:hypothetical protein n=1 Tax=Streptomyces sp. NPDC050485 TaxID=3365617 RepID=UPI003789195B
MMRAGKAWDEQHQVAYGKSAWERAAEMGGYLHCWHVERTLGLADRDARKRYEKKNKGFQERWRTERSVLALILWRTALNHDVLVDQALLTDTLFWSEQDLLAAELPTAPLGIIPPPSTIDPSVLTRISQMLADHGHRYDKPDKQIAASIGYLVRGLRATPGWTFGDWAKSIDRARHHIDLARLLSSPVSAADRAAITRTGLDQPPSYDYPATPEPSDDLHPSWLQRAHRLITLATTLHTVTTATPPGGEPVSELLTVAFKSTTDAFEALADTVQELEQEWAEQALRPDETQTSYGDWQNRTVSRAMWKQVDALEGLARDLVSFLGSLETAA